jgi:radical SAM/SPASM domain protein of ACGX system
MDCYERCYLDYTSGGEYFGNTGLPALNAPENRDDLLVIRSGRTGVKTLVLDRKLQGVKDFADPGPLHDTLSGVPGLNTLLHSLSDHPVRMMAQPCENGSRLIFTTGQANPKNKFPRKEFKKEILQFLKEAGCEETVLNALDQACFNCGVPWLHPQEGYMEWVACLDVAAFSVTLQSGRIAECHAVICVSDKSIMYSGTMTKPTQAYQWHITDNCDQRCKHCYLFAEDARLKCVTTPWDQLILTLDGITEDAAYRSAIPMPVISGGDPILHPDFWRFAGELHKRGLRWLILGNPFHLNKDVCRRLYQLGCFKYQLSLDGLQAYHDHMRKPGSYQATLEGARLLEEAGIRAQFMATASRQNLEDILSCMEIAVENNVSDFTFARYCATSPEKAAESYPSPEEYRAFLLRYYNKAMDYKAKKCRTHFRFKEHLFTLLKYELGEFRPTEFSRQHPDWIFDGCHLGQSVSILANGDLMACRRMESVIGNVKTGKIHDILFSDLCMEYRKISDIQKCRDCELLQWCRGCRAVGFNATGDLQAEDPCCWKKINEGNAG